MTAERDDPPFTLDEPSPLRNLWASVSAVFAKETRWRMRGRRAFVIVTAYLMLLGLLVLAVYYFMYDRQLIEAQFGPGGVVVPGFVAGSVSAGIGQGIFAAILILQTLLTVMVAPALTSGAISVEREKQTLELLITTPVSTLGMVVGKLVSSLAYVFLLVLASVPLMSIAFAFGGIAPEDVVRAYVMLFALAFGIGSIGLLMSALFKRTQVATALSYVIMFALTIGTAALFSYMLISSEGPRRDGRLGQRPAASEAIMWLNPLAADVDLMCTAIQDPYGWCSLISTITGRQLDEVNPPRDIFWPKSTAAFLVVGIASTLLTTQLIAASRRIRSHRPRVPSAEAALVDDEQVVSPPAD